MNAPLTKRLKKKSKSYLFSVLAFFLLIAGLVGGLYYATLQIDYVWRWYNVPNYFVYQETVELKCDVQGDVASVNLKDGVAVVEVEQGDEVAVFKEEAQTLLVEAGDYVYPGDVLAAGEYWRVGILMLGLFLTLKVSLIAIVFGIIIGLFAGIARISDNPALKWSAVTYIELIRGSPLLVQIFIWYFVLGTLINRLLSQNGLSNVPPLWFGVAALATFAGAYVAEIVRAGIQSIHRGQTEAARSLGMTYIQCMLHVILPQALRRIIPPLAGQFISLIKDSSLLGIIAIRELTKATREVVTTSLQPIELWFVCALLYLILTFTFSMFLQYLERRTLVK